MEKGWFATLQQSVGGITADRRLQLLLVAFAFGAFFEGASRLRHAGRRDGRASSSGLGFSPLAASGLSLIANTAPVAYGALGAPIQGLASVTGFDPYVLGAMVGRQLPFFSLIVPFWLIWVFAGFRGMMQIWPAILVCGVSFAVPQFLISNYVNPWIVDIGASLVSMACLVGFLKIWQPAEIWTSPALRTHDISAATLPARAARRRHGRKRRPGSRERSCWAWVPWIILSIIVAIWGTGWFKALVNPIFTWSYPMPGPAQRGPEGSARRRQARRRSRAVFAFTYMSYTGTGILIAAIIVGLRHGLLAAAAHHGLRSRPSGCCAIRSSPSRRCWRSAR